MVDMVSKNISPSSASGTLQGMEHYGEDLKHSVLHSETNEDEKHKR